MQQTTSILEAEAKKVGLYLNPGKCKVLTTNAWNDRSDIQAAGSELGSYISQNVSCEKDVNVRIGKAGAVFGKMKKIWRNTNISLKVKTRLHEALFLSTLLYSAELWPLSATLTKKT